MTISDNAIRVLRNIHGRGLTVLWSYMVPYPVYDDGKEMPMKDWATLERELWRVEHGTVYIRGYETTTVFRKSIRDGYLVEEKIDVIDGVEYPAYRSTLFAVDGPDAVIEESRDTYCPVRAVDYSEQKSDYIIVEKVDKDSYYEESVGITHRYRLSDVGISRAERIE